VKSVTEGGWFEHEILFFDRQQFKKAILLHSQQKGWAVQYKFTGSQRGYLGLGLQRARRQPPGFEFGGQMMLAAVDGYMALSPPPVPPIEVM